MKLRGVDYGGIGCEWRGGEEGKERNWTKMVGREDRLGGIKFLERW